MSKDYNYSYEYDIRYCYPNSNVLKNKLGIKDLDKLKEAELEITSLKIAKARIQKVNGNFDFELLKQIHKYIFEDIYDWAGKVRWVNIAKGNMFCNYEYIESNAVHLFDKLRKEEYLKNTSAEELPFKLAYYLSEMNVIHPFREGNGRTQRLFIEYLAEGNGHVLDFDKVSKEEMILASAESFACRYELMNKMFQNIIEPRNI